MLLTFYYSVVLHTHWHSRPTYNTIYVYVCVYMSIEYKYMNIVCMYIIV